MKEPSRQSIWYAEQRDLAIEERDIALNRARLAESKLADLEPTLSDWQARAEAAEKMAGKWLQLVTLRDNLIFELESQLESETAQRLAAEQRIIEQQAMINILSAPPPPLEPIVKQYERDYAELQKAYFASLDRVAELEAQLAAQGWQPVTEPPEGVLRGFLYDPHVQYFGGDYSIYSPKGGWMHKHRITPTHWRPLPAPPIDPPAPA